MDVAGVDPSKLVPRIHELSNPSSLCPNRAAKERRVKTQPTYDDANLILRLYEMRREDRMRKARAWFTAHFKVKSWDELQKLAPGGSDENASYRMVVTYMLGHGGVLRRQRHSAPGVVLSERP